MKKTNYTNMDYLWDQIEVQLEEQDNTVSDVKFKNVIAPVTALKHDTVKEGDKTPNPYFEDSLPSKKEIKDLGGVMSRLATDAELLK